MWVASDALLEVGRSEAVLATEELSGVGVMVGRMAVVVAESLTVDTGSVNI